LPRLGGHRVRGPPAAGARGHRADQTAARARARRDRAGLARADGGAHVAAAGTPGGGAAAPRRPRAIPCSAAPRPRPPPCPPRRRRATLRRDLTAGPVASLETTAR